jgi:biopolymer transport protein ExbB/TolQ
MSFWSYKDGTPKVGKMVFIVILGFAVLSVGMWALGVVTASPFGRGEAHKQIESAENRVFSQERFHDRLASIRAFDAQLTAQTKTLADFKTEMQGDRNFSTMEELSRLQAIVDGLRNQCITAVNEYDADGRKISKERFRDADLPATVADATPADQYDCVAS